MNLYAITHVHRFGVGVHHALSPKHPTAAEAIAACGIDFEEREDESLEIEEVKFGDVVLIPPVPTPLAGMHSRQLATVLAALRYWQQDLEANDAPPITEHFDEHTPLTTDEIEELCEVLNTGGI